MDNPHGKQICVDYSGYDSTNERDGEWMLELLRNAVKFAEVREVHAHVEKLMVVPCRFCCSSFVR